MKKEYRLPNNEKMLNKAFTLIELLGVLILLAIISLITIPIINNSIKTSRQRALENTIASIEDAAYQYSVQNNLGYSTNKQALYLTELQNKGFLDSEITNPVTNEVLSGCVWYHWNPAYNQYEFEYDMECIYTDIVNFTTDTSGANSPKLLDNMIPIVYENGYWVYSNGTQSDWYSYDEKVWANAIVLNGGVTKNVGDTISEDEIALWYVWIPRYKYQLFNANNESVSEQLINIEFESGTASTGTVSCTDAINQTDDDGNLISETCTNAENGNWYTHPAFTFGNEELTGFWVGKFEISGTIDEITIKPNVISLRNQTTSAFFTAIQNINTTYNLDGNSHVIKNMEWGAVAYLSHSKYGMEEKIYINNSAYYTGRSGGDVAGNSPTESEQYPNESTSSDRYNNSGYYTYDGKIVNYDGSIGDYASDRSLGTKASTTGNIYGVYDMSGGSWEVVMGNMVDSSGSFYSSFAGFESAPEDKYYDKYTYSTDLLTHSRGKLGDATKETLSTFGNEFGSWYNGRGGFVLSAFSWVYRGGDFDNFPDPGSMFGFSADAGQSYEYHSTHAVLTP